MSRARDENKMHPSLARLGSSESSKILPKP